MTATTPPELNTKMTERARRVWSQGDFARAGAEQVVVGELLAAPSTSTPANASSTSPQAPATPPWPPPAGEPA